MTNESLVVLGNNVFANSLIGATIQDGGKRERSDSPESSPHLLAFDLLLI